MLNCTSSTLVRIFSTWPGRVILLTCVVAFSGITNAAAETFVGKSPTNTVSYYRDVRPILQAHCQGCHQPAKLAGGLNLTVAKNLFVGGESGTPSVLPGKPDDSYLIELISPIDEVAEMPKGKAPLNAAQIALIRQWIAEGAVDDSPPSATARIDADHPPVYRGPPVITALDWSPDGTVLAIAGFHEVLLHKADGTGLIARLVGLSERIESVRFSPDGAKLAVTGGNPGQKGEVQIWDVATRQLLHSIAVTHDSVYGASWSPDGKLVAFGAADSAVRAIDVETGNQVLYQSAHDDWCLDTVFSLDGSHVVSVGRDMTAKLIEVATQRFVDNITSITPGALKGGIQAVERHPLRDEILFGGADGTPRIYRMHRSSARMIGDDANLLWELPPLPGRIFSVDISTDGRTIVAGSSLDGHGYVHIYGMEPTPAIPEAIQAILHKPVPQRSTEERAQLQKHFEEGIQTLAKVAVPEGGVYAVALSPDGQRVAVGGSDGTVRIINTHAGLLCNSFVPVEIQKTTDSSHTTQSVSDAATHLEDTRTSNDDPPLPTDDAVVALTVEPARIRMEGPTRYVQVVVTAQLASGAKVDVTRHARYSLSSPIVSVSRMGLVRPLANGNSLLSIEMGEKSANLEVDVRGFDAPLKPDFIRDVAPILARAGCNQGTCHGAQQGKNGFKLSLRGYDPVFDVRALADDLASRRVNVASPADSLMLLKPTASVPHQGGQVLVPGSPYYEILRQWIASGAHLDLSSPRVISLQIAPTNPVIETVGGKQQVRVMATYADGTERDVTREAFLESSNTDVVKTIPEQPGLLESLRRGEAAVLVRYEGHYSATTLTVMGDRTGFDWQEIPANNRIDELVIAKLRRTKTLPSPLTDDYEFLRRLHLDLTGLPPTPEQIQTFMNDPRENRAKRDALVDQLVGNNDYVDYWTNKWADLLLVNSKFLGLEGATALREWIRDELAANTPYDQFVRQIITATGSTKDNPPAAYFKILRTPDALVENTTQLFLATRFNCNKCHDHPFERWTQDQYYQLAAYFAHVNLKKDPASGDAVVQGSAVEEARPLYEIVADAAEGEITHARTGQVTAPTFPFQCQHELEKDATRREQLAAWLTSPDNPYFARSYVNRIWGYLTGRGIIEPLDDIRAGNPPTNPELLEYLTKEFIESGFNMRHIMSLICKSRTYQLSVETNCWNADDDINFSHARARRLSAEVLYDAIYRTTGATSQFTGVPPGTRAATLPDVGIELPDGFLGNLGRPARESACECERTSNLQLGPIMALVSGPTVSNAISNPENSLAKLVQDVADNGELVNKLFLRILNRPVKPDELTSSLEMFQQLEADHATLVAELEAYSEEIAPKLAKRELERQQLIASLRTQLEAQRELAKLRQPRLEEERQKRIAKAQEALSDYDKTLLAKLPQWEAAQKSVITWHVLNPVEMDATHRAKFSRQPDGSIFVEGENGRGAYRIVAPLPIERITGIRVEALTDERLPNRGPGRSSSGNFVVTELGTRVLNSGAPLKLVKTWDFANADETWQRDDGTIVLHDAGIWHLFGNTQRAGISTSFKEPAGTYLVELVTGVNPATTYSVQWSTVSQPDFDESRSVRRALTAGKGGRIPSAIPITAQSELTGLRILVEDDGAVLPLDALRLFTADAPLHADLKLQNAKATFSQTNYAVGDAIDGNSTTGEDNGWAISPQTGRNQTAVFETASPWEGEKGHLLELTIHQNYNDGQHSLGRFRISVTDATAPLDFGLPPAVAAILAKPAGDRSGAELEVLLSHFRQVDEHYRNLEAELAAAKKPVPPDVRLQELEAQLAQAIQPLPLDEKLQELRRAVALSEEQLQNKRLTVAQDIAWALINSPAFLYNH
jgi:WD40 repeat protein